MTFFLFQSFWSRFSSRGPRSVELGIPHLPGIGLLMLVLSRLRAKTPRKTEENLRTDSRLVSCPVFFSQKTPPVTFIFFQTSFFCTSFPGRTTHVVLPCSSRVIPYNWPLPFFFLSGFVCQLDLIFFHTLAYDPTRLPFFHP